MLPTATATAGIIGTVLILLLPSAVFATDNDNYQSSGKDTFKVNVYASGINRNTDNLDVSVTLESGARESDNVFVSGSSSGEQFLTQFVFNRGESDVGESFRACVTSDGERSCETGVNSPRNAPEDITVHLRDQQDDFSDTSYQIAQRHDFDNDQDANCNITGDNNSCEIRQGNSFSDTIRDIGDSIEQIFDN